MRVVARRHHLLRPRRRPRPGRPRARRRRGRLGAARRARPSRGRSTAVADRARSRSSVRPEEVPAERKAELLRELDERARPQGGEVAQVLASYAEARREVTVANSEGLLTGDDRTRTRIGVQAVARRGDAVETGAETLGGHRGFELLEDDPAAIAAEAARQGADPARRRPGAGRLDAGRRRRRLRRRPLPRDDRPRPRGRPRPEGRERLRRQARRAGRRSRCSAPTTTAACRGEWGTDAIDDEGTPTQKTLVIEDGRLVSYLYDRLRAERDGGRLDRQRPPRELPPPADPAHDQHLHRPRRRRARGDHRRGREAASTRSPSAAARSTRRPATSSSASPRAT